MEQEGAKAERGYQGPHVGRTNKRTVRRVNMTHHAKFCINRSNQHVGFLKFRNCNCHTVIVSEIFEIIVF